MNYVLAFYRSPSQSSDALKNVLSRFHKVIITDISLSNTAFRMMLGGFNCRSNSLVIFPQKKVLIWNQSLRLKGFTSLSQIQHTFFLSLPIVLY